MQFDYKQYYKPEIIDGYSDLLRLHLMNKYEHKHGILAIIRNETIREHYGVSDKKVLEDCLVFYNKQPNTSAHWFYTKDIEKAHESKERSRKEAALPVQ